MKRHGERTAAAAAILAIRGAFDKTSLTGRAGFALSIGGQGNADQRRWAGSARIRRRSVRANR
jgi:hypothetical protein